jgi:hypothetical protein
MAGLTTGLHIRWPKVADRPRIDSTMASTVRMAA